jgi:hypothetical protein
MEFAERADDRPEPISIARCRELFADELAQLQPTPGYMRLLKEGISSADLEGAESGRARGECDR